MSSSPAKVLVTGASGFLAGHVIQQLMTSGHEVRGTVRSLKNEAKVKHLRNLCPDAKHPLELVEADLLGKDSWTPAVSGMDYVIHVASPLPLSAPRDENDVIKPAVEGTLNVLKACAQTSSVKRVVLTSSVMAIHAMPENSGRAMTEDDWSDVTNIPEPYGKSKTLAENAAWQFVQDMKEEDNKFELVVICPSFILGPPLHGTLGASLDTIIMLLERKLPLVPRINLPIVDVRDVARAHVIAMTSQEAAGQRIILTSDTNLWMHDIAVLLKTVFGPQGYNIPTTIAPKPLIWIASLFDPLAKSVLPHIGVVHLFSNDKMKTMLGMEPRDVRETIIEMAYGIIEAGFVRKTPLYKGPGGDEERQLYMNVKFSE